MIKPTVGRVVWYWHCLADIYSTVLGKQPMAATICYVHDDHSVNLSVVDHEGVQFGVTHAPLLQDDDERADKRGCAQWMPYQKGQAAKTEALEAKMAETPVDALTTLLSSITQPKQLDPAPAAPALTMADIEAAIADESYQVLNGSLVTTCCLTLRNGAKVVGINYGSVSASNYCPKKGRQYAREHAIEQVWPLEGYLLRQRLYEQSQDGGPQ